MKRILFVVGARPNFMKIAPIMAEMKQHPHEFEQFLLHTGQHYDTNMSQIFFDELGLPKPNINLEVGSGSHAQQTAQVMQRFEPVLLEYKPDWVVVPGDVNSTLACALVAAKLGVNVAHIEAGLRSFDPTMPEEVNRLLTDQISKLLFTPSMDGNENLRNEGIAEERIHFVGNVMIDSLVRLLPLAKDHWPALQRRFELDQFALVTLHRPSNVDDLSKLQEILRALDKIAKTVDVFFPVHPRTRKRIIDNQLSVNNIKWGEPLGYLDFLALQTQAQFVITDSGGVQEETAYLGVPCITVRPNTERPATIQSGTNQLVSSTFEGITSAVQDVQTKLRSNSFKFTRPVLWDGHSAKRIVSVFHNFPTKF